MGGVRISSGTERRKTPAEDDNHGYFQKAVCPRCKVPMLDAEPMIRGGEFFHPVSACSNSGKIMRFDRGIRVAQFKRKRDRRAKRRGARLARGLRPARGE